jgi:hypothetical protein
MYVMKIHNSDHFTNSDYPTSILIRISEDSLYYICKSLTVYMCRCQYYPEKLQNHLYGNHFNYIPHFTLSFYTLFYYSASLH